MKINKIKVNSYGKLKNKEIELNKGINIIYGKNETGKSTLLRFIVNSFYGISKNKKGKDYSDFEKFTPWIGEDFSGKIEYELDNNKKYEVYRDFKKKNPKIFNENKEDISKEFNIDRTKGNEFFFEQTNVDEELFLSTLIVGQSETKLENQEQSVLVQKISNLVGTGNDNTSYKKAIERINRRKLDEIGTKNSREKPINIVERNIKELEEEIIELKKYENFKYEIEENKNNLKEEINNLENENNFLKEIKTISEKENLEKEKIKIKENIKNENNNKINIIKNEIKNIENNNKETLEFNLENIENNIKKINKEKNIKNKINKKIFLIFIFIILINILQFVFINNKIFNYIFLLTVPMDLIFSLIYKINSNKKIKKEKDIEENIEKNKLENIDKIKYEIKIKENEINILEKNNIEIENEIKNINNKLILNINLEKEKIKNKYLNNIEKNKLNNLMNIENVYYELENLQENINNKKIELETLNFEQKNIEPKLENLSKLEEELVNNKEKMLTFENEILSFDLAKEILEASYEKMKNLVTPKFTKELSNTISEITDGKYKNVMFNDEEGLIVEIDNGNYIPVSKLSIGTIDQLYLSLRLSMAEDLSNEKLPIILDEVFAYYDDERLKNILLFISEKFKKHQIIIFTCTDREKKLLNYLNIKSNYIEL